MDYIKINEYPLERLVFGDNDYYDVDYFDGVGYQSAKIKGSVIKAGIISALETIYTSDGTLNSDRTIQGDLKTLFINNLKKYSVNVNPNAGTTALDFTIVPNGDLLRIRDTTANIDRLRINQNGEVLINEAYSFPLLDGLAGQVLATDGAGNLSFINMPSDVNIYNSDGALNSARTIDGNSFGIEVQNSDYFLYSVVGYSPAQNELVAFFINPTQLVAGGRLFTIVDALAPKNRLSVLKTGEVEINEAYKLPLIDGTNGQVLKTNGAGVVSWANDTDLINNIYNTDGTLTANRILTGDNFTLLFQSLGKFSVHSHINNAENIEFRVRTNTGFYSFIIRDHNTNASLLGVKEGKTEINGAYTLPTVTGTSGQVLTTDGAGVTSWQNIPEVWKAPDVQLFDALGSGGLTSTVNAGAGYNRYFNGTGTAGRLSFNIGLRNNGVDYDGASIQIKFAYQLFNTNGGGNVSFSVIYKFVTANGTTNAETGATVVTTLVNVTGRAVNTLYEDIIATISGASGSDFLMLSIVRNTGGGTNSDLVDGIGIELIKI